MKVGILWCWFGDLWHRRIGVREAFSGHFHQFPGAYEYVRGPLWIAIRRRRGA